MRNITKGCILHTRILENLKSHYIHRDIMSCTQNSHEKIKEFFLIRRKYFRRQK